MQVCDACQAPVAHALPTSTLPGTLANAAHGAVHVWAHVHVVYVRHMSHAVQCMGLQQQQWQQHH
jgi:hypothetical protein